MALTPSHMVPLGTVAPDFELYDTVSSQPLSLAQLRSSIATVIMFICNHCPYVQHIQQGLVKLAQDYQDKGIVFIAINANDAQQYSEDNPEQMKQIAQQLGYPFPYLYDENQAIAKAYQAACTPDFYIFDADLQCIYRGQFDASRPGNDIPVTGKDIRNALDAALAGRPVEQKQQASIGCSIKWKGSF